MGDILPTNTFQHDVLNLKVHMQSSDMRNTGMKCSF